MGYAAQLIGPVSSAPDITGQLSVLNQTIVVSAGTVLDSLLLSDLVQGRTIEISGVTDANGHLVASYIRPATNSVLQIAGTVSAVDNNQQRLTVRNITVALEQADVSALNGEPLVPGASVIVIAPGDQYDASTNTLSASLISPGLSISSTSDAQIELAGFVQSFDNVSSFTVDGLRITTSAATRYETVNGLQLDASAVAINSLIEVEGIFSLSGAIDAQRIVVLPVENTELVGSLEGIDAAAKTVTLLGVPIQTTSLTRFRGSDDDTMNFASLRVGDYAEIDASFTANGLLATQIEIDDTDDEALLEGPVTQIDAIQRRIEIAGISITFDDETDFEIDQNDNEQEIDEQAFLAATSIGSIVKAKWKVFTSIAVPVDELEIE